MSLLCFPFTLACRQLKKCFNLIVWNWLKITLSPFDYRAHKIAITTANCWKSWSVICFSNGEICNTIHWIMLSWACHKTFLSNRQTKQANTKVNYSLSESVHIFKAIRKLWNYETMIVAHYWAPRNCWWVNIGSVCVCFDDIHTLIY